jgi:hypothetical protein
MESHHVTVCRELTKLSRLEIPSQRLMINLPPGYGKSVLVSMWTAWNIAQHPDSNFLYISFSHDLASKHTYFIKSIVSSPIFKHLFNVSIKVDSRAKDHFATEQGGIIRAFGSGGPVVGSDAGLPGLDRFSGAVVIDDAHKPDEVHSDAVRGNVIRNYQETISRRPRGVNVPIIFIGQRLHEEDLPAWLEDGNDTSAWDILKLKGLNDAGNALYPEVMPKDKLLALQEKSPYVFASQYQQNPIPSGGALFKPDWFVSLVEEPPMLSRRSSRPTRLRRVNHGMMPQYLVSGAFMRLKVLGVRLALRVFIGLIVLRYVLNQKTSAITSWSSGRLACFMQRHPRLQRLRRNRRA